MIFAKRIYNEEPPRPRIVATSSVPAVVANTVEPVPAIAPRSRLANFYRGFSATIMGMLPYAGMSFLTQDTAGDILRHPLITKYTTLPKPASSPPEKSPP